MQYHQYIDDLDLRINDDNVLLGKKTFFFFDDSWFGSIKIVSEVRKLSHHACLNIENGDSRCPEAFLEDTMKDFLGRTWIVWEGHAEKEGVDLVCIGYKYNKQSVIFCYYKRG